MPEERVYAGAIATNVTPEALKGVELLYGLWMHENTIVNQKLTHYLMAQAFLVVTYTQGGSARDLAVGVGILLSLLWFLSIGRTLAYRKHWESERKRIVNEFAAPLLFRDSDSMPWYGKVNSMWVLFGVPIIGCALWLSVWVEQPGLGVVQSNISPLSASKTPPLTSSAPARVSPSSSAPPAAAPTTPTKRAP